MNPDNEAKQTMENAVAAFNEARSAALDLNQTREQREQRVAEANRAAGVIIELFDHCDEES